MEPSGNNSLFHFFIYFKLLKFLLKIIFDLSSILGLNLFQFSFFAGLESKESKEKTVETTERGIYEISIFNNRFYSNVSFAN